MAMSKQDKLTEATQLKLLQQAQRAEINALASALRSQGLSDKEVNSSLKAEKTANTNEYNTFKKQTKQDGIQYFSSGTDANGNLVVNPVASTSSTYSGDTANYVNNTLDSARDLYGTYNLSQVRQYAGDGSYSGVGLDQLTNAVLNRNADGTFNKGSGDTKLYGSTYKLLSDATNNYGKTFTSDEVGKVKLVGQDANGNDIYQHKLYGENNASYSLLTKNNDGTYTNIGYTATRVPPSDDGGFFGSTLGKVALGVGAALTGGALAPAVAGALGTSAAVGGALAGAVTGGLASGLTGGNILTGAALGGLGGYAGGGGFDGIGSTNVSEGLGNTTGATTGATQVGTSNLTDYLGSTSLGDATTGAVGTGTTGFGLNPGTVAGGAAGGTGISIPSLSSLGTLGGTATMLPGTAGLTAEQLSNANALSQVGSNAASGLGYLGGASSLPSGTAGITGVTSGGLTASDFNNARKLANVLTGAGKSFANSAYPQTGIGEMYVMKNPFFKSEEKPIMAENNAIQPVYLGQLANLLRG